MPVSVLDTLLDSHGRNNTILLNVLWALPEGGVDTKAMESSPSVAGQFSHIQQTRLFWLSQTAPEFAEVLAPLFCKDGQDCLAERDPQCIEEALKQSASAVCKAVKNRLHTGQAMKGKNASYDHPSLWLQQML